MPGITKKDRPLTAEHFAEFEKCYGDDPNGRAKRKESQSPAGRGYLGGDRWRLFLPGRGGGPHFKLDSFKWLKDDSLEDADELPPPEELATDAISELEGAVEELNAVLVLLENGNGKTGRPATMSKRQSDRSGVYARRDPGPGPHGARAAGDARFRPGPALRGDDLGAESSGAAERRSFPGRFRVSAYAARVYAFDITNCDIKDPGRGGRRKLPWVFTEHGVAMLSSVLRSPTAVRVNIEIMRTFVRLRRLMATPGELVEQLTRLAETVRLHDEQIKAIAHVLNKMMERPEEPKRHIGFHVRGEEGEGMKRDMDLVRKILMVCVEHGHGFAPPGLSIERYSPEEVGYHVHLMMQAGLVEGVGQTGAGDPPPTAIVGSVTWTGDGFEASRDEGLWSKAKQAARSSGGMAMEVVKSVLVQLAIDVAKKTAGLP